MSLYRIVSSELDTILVSEGFLDRFRLGDCFLAVVPAQAPIINVKGVVALATELAILDIDGVDARVLRSAFQAAAVRRGR